MPRIEEEVGQLLGDRGLTISVAEACTAGLIGSMLCSVPGSSRYFHGGVIAYTGGSKTRVLGISADMLTKEGTVSPATALEMARRVRELFDTDVGVSTTGVAGPTTGSSSLPVGLFYLGVAARDGHGATKELNWTGDRNANREHTAWAALNLVKEYLAPRG